MSGSFGWYSNTPLGVDPVGEPSREVLTPELADVRRLARRAVRSVVRSARKDEPGRTVSSLLHQHFGDDAGHD
jgi:hypothetical protein